MKIIVPVDVCIKRFYRVYAEVEENAIDEEILERVTDDVLEYQDDALCPDPDIFIEEHDMECVKIDREGIFPAAECDEISEILHSMGERS